MKSTASGSGIEGRIVRTIPNQVIASLIFQNAANAIAQVIVVFDGDTACLPGEIVQSLLCFESSDAATAQHLLNIAAPRVIGSSQAQGLQASCIHRVNHD